MTAARQIARMIDNPDACRDITVRNYHIARRHFSYEALQEKLNGTMAELLGDGFQRLGAADQSPMKQRIHAVDARQEATAADIRWAQAYN
jgi:hypothetical protein